MKLNLIGGLDPFTLNDSQLSYNVNGIPPITYMDIVAYLLTHSYYTNEQMKTFKSLQAYKYFESGFVIKIGTKIVNDIFVVVGKVSLGKFK